MVWDVNHFLLVGVQPEHVHRLAEEKMTQWRTFETSLSHSWCMVPERTPDSKAWKTVVTSISSLSVSLSGWLGSGQWSCGIVKNVTFPDRMYAMSLVKYILWLNDLRTYILQEAPCHICTDRNIHSPRDVGQINDLLHEGRHLGSVLPDSSGKSFIRKPFYSYSIIPLAGCWLHRLTLLSWTRVGVLVTVNLKLALQLVNHGAFST